MKTLSMKFQTEDGKPATINIPNCSDTLDEKKVKDAAAVILSKNIFKTKNGELKTFDSARLIETSVQKFETI